MDDYGELMLKTWWILQMAGSLLIQGRYLCPINDGCHYFLWLLGPDNLSISGWLILSGNWQLNEEIKVTVSVIFQIVDQQNQQELKSSWDWFKRAPGLWEAYKGHWQHRSHRWKWERDGFSANWSTFNLDRGEFASNKTRSEKLQILRN